jgi:D-beta-D-heptose 7-phosphate kinase/D-beta-D-heptose 1-phosphate adenosyltransferase|tara:strand:+ start:104 stop:496 length:393 start_codon:yes stop_codon:yes gene_type:complete
MTVVFTNGCFDILHRGHVELLKFCQGLGDKTVVGLNSDSSIKSLKGPSRPINSVADRKVILESLVYVDEVIVFEEATPHNLINRLQPDIIVKGGDYTAEDVVGSDISEVVIFDYLNGYSTTQTIQDIINR